MITAMIATNDNQPNHRTTGFGFFGPAALGQPCGSSDNWRRMSLMATSPAKGRDLGGGRSML